ncbi:hypothetical protein HUN08_04770 [Gordonia sp. X0973]|uniref:hypothetical protein n=1 Tax=Gordonia sp. X0973 TaxID=2742602 RepID=UPI000F53A4FB|nr:hypothetical protein [Gordonia sp. X0973]QKT06578.1 hypothetical protein HUN08_04770 [Gordonia sp. X0973]
MLYVIAAAAVIGEAIYLLMHNPNGLDFRNREFADALHDRELRRERERKAARHALEAGAAHHAA